MIQEWRIEADLTQQELGDKAGLSKRTVGSIERGGRAPTKLEIVKLCQALGRAHGDLITISYRSFLDELNEISRQLQDQKKPPQSEEKGSQSAPAPGARVDQLIDQMAILLKELYRESRADFLKVSPDWLAQPDLDPPSPPARPRKKRVRRRRGPAKE